MSSEWTRYIPSGNRSRVVEASCCSLYQLLQEGGAYVVVAYGRRPYSLSLEETARGPASLAQDVFRELVAAHLTGTQKHHP